MSSWIRSAVSSLVTLDAVEMAPTPLSYLFLLPLASLAGDVGEEYLPTICETVGGRAELVKWQLHVISHERAGSTWCWYAACAIMRVCAYRNPEAAARHRVDCGGALDEADPAPFLVTKQHTGVNASWGHDSRFAARPGSAYLSFKGFRQIDFLVVKSSPGFDKSLVPASVAHTSLFDEFKYLDTAVVPLELQPLFGLTDDETKEVFSQMRMYGVLRQCCAAQASVRQEKPVTDAPDYDLPRCEEYDLNVVEANFLQSRLARDNALDVYESYGFVSPPIAEGLCELHRAGRAMRKARTDEHVREHERLLISYCERVVTEYRQAYGREPTGRWVGEFCGPWREAREGSSR